MLKIGQNWGKFANYPPQCSTKICTLASSATILLALAPAPQVFLNGCADACAASIFAILSAIVQALLKYDLE